MLWWTVRLHCKKRTSRHISNSPSSWVMIYKIKVESTFVSYPTFSLTTQTKTKESGNETKSTSRFSELWLTVLFFSYSFSEIPVYWMSLLEDESLGFWRPVDPCARKKEAARPFPLPSRICFRSNRRSKKHNVFSSSSIPTFFIYADSSYRDDDDDCPSQFETVKSMKV